MTTLRQELNAEEDRLTSSLFKIYNKIQRDLAQQNVTLDEMQLLYRKRADDLIRSSVTAFYVLSARKTVERDVKVPFFLTEQDLSEIRRLSQKYQDSFWMALNREVNMRTSEGVNTKLAPTYDPTTLLLVKKTAQPIDARFRQGFIGRIAQSIHGEVAASAVVSKGRQVVLPLVRSNRGDTRRRRTTAGVFRKAATAVGEGEEQPHLVWVTADDEVTCAQCQALEGTTYSLEEGDAIIPSEDTHPRCRCSLELVVADATEGEEEEAEF